VSNQKQIVSEIKTGKISKTVLVKTAQTLKKGKESKKS